MSEKSISERLAEVKHAYDSEYSGRYEWHCDLCTDVKGSVEEVVVRHEDTGKRMRVSLCEECREITEEYQEGKDVDWPIQDQ